MATRRSATKKAAAATKKAAAMSQRRSGSSSKKTATSTRTRITSAQASARKAVTRKVQRKTAAQKSAAKSVAAKRASAAKQSAQKAVKKAVKKTAKKVAKKTTTAATTKKATQRRARQTVIKATAKKGEQKKVVAAKPAKNLATVRSATSARSIRQRAPQSVTPSQSDSASMPARKTSAAKKKVQQVTETGIEQSAAVQTQEQAVTVQQPSAKPTVRYSDEELEEFRQIILAEREKTLDEIRMLRERLEDLTNYETSEETGIYSMHMAEQGSEAYEREKTYAQIQRMTDYLRKLDEALKRIENKTYGICRMCGILIAKERLRAVPITTLSASWKLRGKCPEDGIDRVGPDVGGE